VGAGVTVVASKLHAYGVAAAVVAAVACFLIRMTGVRFGLNAPRPRGIDD
jgi:NhaP-type Na+/H+ or K+/H+ antiporter